jgi:hypothetical protein
MPVFCPLDDAREWMLECVDAGIYLDDPEELEERIAEMTDAQVKRWVDREYAGGWKAFVDQFAPEVTNPIGTRCSIAD